MSSAALPRGRRGGGNRAVTRSGTNRKDQPFWRWKEVRRIFWLVGIPAAVLLAWYAYTVVELLGHPAAPPVAIDERSPAASSESKSAAGLAERAAKEGFRLEEVDRCRNMMDEYTTPKGWFYSDADIYQLVGLPRTATQAQLNERCVFYAKAVADMERMARHVRHAFVCGGSYLDVGSNGRFYIKADPDGRGALQKLDASAEKLVHIPWGTATIINIWQVYNVGDGCVIVGLSKSTPFRMSGTVVYDN